MVKKTLLTRTEAGVTMMATHIKTKMLDGVSQLQGNKVIYYISIWGWDFGASQT